MGLGLKGVVFARRLLFELIVEQYIYSTHPTRHHDPK